MHPFPYPPQSPIILEPLSQLKLKLEYHFLYRWVDMCVINDSRVLIGEYKSDRLYAFDVNAEHKLSLVGTVSLVNKFYYFACTRDGDVGDKTIICFSHKNIVSLHRLRSLTLEPIEEIAFHNPWKVLFNGPILLVA